MMVIFSAIARIASIDSLTAPAVLSAFSAPWTAICSIWRLFEAFWVIEAVICSRLAVVSSTEAPCSLVPRATTWADDETWEEADDRVSTPARASPIISASFSSMSRRARPRLSFSERGSTRRVRSPPAIASATSVVSTK